MWFHCTRIGKKDMESLSGMIKNSQKKIKQVLDK